MIGSKFNMMAKAISVALFGNVSTIPPVFPKWGGLRPVGTARFYNHSKYSPQAEDRKHGFIRRKFR